jgi:hypothetical protein
VSHASSAVCNSWSAWIEYVGWSNAKTFQTFYNKPIDASFNFGATIMNALDRL